MSLFTIEEMTNLYLYGTKEKPQNLGSDGFIRSSDIGLTTNVSVDVNEYMAGPGRFVNAAMFADVQLFFNPDIEFGPGVYDESTILEAFDTNGIVK